MAARAIDLLGPSGPFARNMPGYEERKGQVAMALAVERCLDHGSILLCEAGTGTGKTLAYLVPALLSGLKVVVSTGTKNLQEQILRKDVPLLAAHLPVAFTAASLKGISNYLCLRRFKDFVASQQAAGAGDDALEALATWADHTASGDRGELPDLPDDSPQWHEVSSTAETRLGPRCPFVERCFFTRARRAAQ